jgi:hypothetical protein
MKNLLLIILLFLSVRAFAPIDNRTPVICEAVNPFTQLINAVVTVESSGNNLAYNPIEEAYGPFQIRPIRLLDYNQRTGSSYTMKDCFDYEVSKRIFVFYAAQIGPYDFERIAKAWNGSGEMTIEYWNKVKAKL